MPFNHEQIHQSSLGPFAPSPYQPDPDLVQSIDFGNWKERYSQQQPAEILRVGKGPNGLPNRLWNDDRSQELYEVAFPDCDVSMAGKFGADMFWKHRHDESTIVPLTYSPSNASICVSPAASPGRRKASTGFGLMQLAQQSWDVAFYFPREPKRYQTQLQQARRNSFDAFDPCFLWKSCDGDLTWTCRYATDAKAGPEMKPKKPLVLLDSYDRLVAMVCYPDKDVELRLYGEFPENLKLEIVTSYVAFALQDKRRVDWDYINRTRPIYTSRPK